MHEWLFHAMNLSDTRDLRRWGTDFDLAECPGTSAPCVPKYLRQWQAVIRTSLPSSWLHHVAGAKRWHSCSVVGSASSLLRTTRGKVIDAAEAVFRVNVRGAGARTTFGGHLPNSVSQLAV